MGFLLAILLFINPVKDLNKVAETNALKKEAKEAYEAGNFEKAVEHYEKLTQALEVLDENLLMNLANAYYKQGNIEQATSQYQNLSQSENNNVRADAYNQMGIIAHQQQKNEEALEFFKKALKANPSNEAARFNYSKLKKEQEENEQNQNEDDQNGDNKDQQQNKDQQNQDQDQQDQENQDQQDQSGDAEQETDEQEQQEQQDQGDEQEENQKSTAEKLEEMNMTEEKAKMILEAMKNNEIQYIQQNKKKPQSRVDDGRPDW